MSAAEFALQQEVHALYSNHQLWLQGWLRRKLGNAFDAADLAQDVFLRVLTRQQPVQAREPRAYLSTIARGLVIDHWRRRELELAWLETLAAMPEAEAPSPESRLILLETLVTIDRMLDAADELSSENSGQIECGSADFLHVAAARRLNRLSELKEFWTCDAAQAALAKKSGLKVKLFEL